MKEVLTGSDGHIRGAVVRVHSKANRLISLRRSVRHLYPLEIQVCTTQTSSTKPMSESTHDRPKRAAAVRAADKWKGWIQEVSQD